MSFQDHVAYANMQGLSRFSYTSVNGNQKTYYRVGDSGLFSANPTMLGGGQQTPRQKRAAARKKREEQRIKAEAVAKKKKEQESFKKKQKAAKEKENKQFQEYMKQTRLIKKKKQQLATAIKQKKQNPTPARTRKVVSLKKEFGKEKKNLLSKKKTLKHVAASNHKIINAAKKKMHAKIKALNVAKEKKLAEQKKTKERLCQSAKS